VIGFEALPPTIELMVFHKSPFGAVTGHEATLVAVGGDSEGEKAKRRTGRGRRFGVLAFSRYTPLNGYSRKHPRIVARGNQIVQCDPAVISGRNMLMRLPPVPAFLRP
jgi:hypothetical protein